MPSEYDRREIERMQAEAVRRVREMQARAKQSLAQHAPAAPPPSHNQNTRDRHTVYHQPRRAAAHSPQPERRPSPPETRQPAQKSNSGGLLSSLFGGGGLGNLLGGGSGKKGGFDFLKLFNLKEFSMDSDRTLILMMLILLGGKEMDEMLMLALLYIML